MNKKNDELNFEDSLMRLEQIAELLENENTPLEESISLFEEGIALKEICDQKLKKAKLKIEKIIKSKNTITTEDFE
ncbi:exodeoxyribonuclease VII small subunit [Alphaproteobacteria bacterium]|jgi:exodeoxyribonuclease VII small subunit|nr:exodeoxyribonuclease VII small subunit [Alphaproteobacteria bacterium]|tara:strand:- start:18 stop:245 length:228 start_codon:yes stop_codon:yes gene_type:complete